MLQASRPADKVIFSEQLKYDLHQIIKTENKKQKKMLEKFVEERNTKKSFDKFFEAWLINDLK